MQINLIHKLTSQPLIIETEHNDPDEAIALEYIGDENAIAFLIRATEGKYGYYGHIFSLNSTTNLDLQKVVYDLKEFDVLSVKPQIKANRVPRFAVT